MAVSRTILKSLFGVSGVVHRQPLLVSSSLRCSAILSTRSVFKRDYQRPGQPPDTRWPWQKINFDFYKGVEGVKKHFGLLKDEFFQRWVGPEGKPIIENLLKQTHVMWEFRGPESLNEWIVSSDQEIGGQSVAYIKLGKNNTTCLLYGTLCSVPPQDGVTRYSGYCSMRSKQPLISFDRKKHYDWSSFNTIHLRIRGDGRPWMILVATESYFSHNKDDIYSYFIYTRGGPHWQDIKIPFSKFFMSSRGRIQDGQYRLLLDKVNAVGFTLGDRADGPFQLEIDFIGLCKDWAHTEEFAYELYKKN